MESKGEVIYNKIGKGETVDFYGPRWFWHQGRQLERLAASTMSRNFPFPILFIENFEPLFKFLNS